MSRRGTTGEQLTWMWTFFLLLLIAMGMVAGKFLFYGKDLDFRKADAGLLHDRLKECIIETHVFDVLNEGSANELFELCYLDRRIIEEYFLMLIEIDGKELYSWKGDSVSCMIGEKNDDYPKCKESVFFYDFRGTRKSVHLLVGSNQHIRRKLL